MCFKRHIIQRRKKWQWFLFSIQRKCSCVWTRSPSSCEILKAAKLTFFLPYFSPPNKKGNYNRSREHSPTLQSSSKKLLTHHSLEVPFSPPWEKIPWSPKPPTGKNLPGKIRRRMRSTERGLLLFFHIERASRWTKQPHSAAHIVSSAGNWRRLFISLPSFPRRFLAVVSFERASSISDDHLAWATRSHRE